MLGIDLSSLCLWEENPPLGCGQEEALCAPLPYIPLPGPRAEEDCSRIIYSHPEAEYLRGLGSGWDGGYLSWVPSEWGQDPWEWPWRPSPDLPSCLVLSLIWFMGQCLSEELKSLRSQGSGTMVQLERLVWEPGDLSFNPGSAIDWLCILGQSLTFLRLPFLISNRRAISAPFWIFVSIQYDNIHRYA